MDIKCIGCGALLHNESPKQVGYTPIDLATLEEREQADIYCQRCFRLRNYNELSPVAINPDLFIDIIKDIDQKHSLIVYVIDLFDLSGSMLPKLTEWVGTTPVLIIANKRDLLPKSVNDRKIILWIKQHFAKSKLNIVDICVTHTQSVNAVEASFEMMLNYKKNKNIYVIGVTNVGKSSLINQWLNLVTGSKNTVTTSYFPGTTIDQIEIPFDDGTYLIDTPGVINEQQIAHYLTAQELKIITPKKEVKPKVYQLNPQQTLFLSYLARFDFVKGSRQSFVLYTANSMPIHRTKLAHADEFFTKHKDDLLALTTDGSEHSFVYQCHSFVFDGKHKKDIVISGLGWIRVSGEATIHIHLPKHIGISIRDALI